MAERNSWAVSTGGGILTVEDGRLAIGALVMPGGAVVNRAKSGFRPSGTDPGKVTATGTPDGFVHVAPFQLVMQSGRATAAGVYLQCLDAIKDINILSTPANATNPRDDLIIAQQSDAFYGDGTNLFVVKQVVGTPAGVPSDPAVTGSPDWVPLARVRVPATATTIVTGNITDLRSGGHASSLTGGQHSVATGGVLPLATQAQRDALLNAYDGMTVWRQDVDFLEAWNGTAWLTLTPYRPPVQVLTSTAATVTFSGIPSSLRTITVRWTTRGDTAATTTSLLMRVNGDSTSNYFGNVTQVQNVTTANGTFIGTTSLQMGSIFAATSGANQFTVGEVTIPGWDGSSWATPHAKLNGVGRFAMYDTAANSFVGSFGFLYNVGGPYTSLTLFPLAGNFVAGSEFTLEGV